MIERMRDKIEARGARMVSLLVVKPGIKSIEEMKHEVNELVQEEDLSI